MPPRLMKHLPSTIGLRRSRQNARFVVYLRWGMAPSAVHTDLATSQTPQHAENKQTNRTTRARALWLMGTTTTSPQRETHNDPLPEGGKQR